jgi:hypothetical protein
VLSVPTDIGYLAYGFIDTDSRYQRETEKIRMFTAIKNGILDNENFRKQLRRYWPSSIKVCRKKQNNIYGKVVASVAGRTVTNSVIAGKLATVIAQRSSLLISLRGGMIGNLLLAGGMAERSIYTSERLRQSDPEVYYALRHRNFDLLYFLVEPALNPFLEALHVRRTQGQGAFEQILDMVESELHATK